MFGSTWTNPQQNQQQPATGAFGQPSAFGGATNNAFGSTSTFGQSQQQPQVNPMFGSITTTPSTGTTGTSAFGGFGGATNNTTSAFGAKPAGFGAFGGGTGAFGGGGTTTGAFGQPANTAAPSVFGQPSTTTTTGAFGGGSNLFGGPKSTFGSTPLGGATATPPVVTTGSSNPAYIATTEKDAGTTLQFQSISCMPAYQGYSFEEIRVQDYAQNRKTASTGNTFGGNAFGTQPASTSVFGAQPAQPTNSLFGGGTNTTTSNNAFGAFGQPAQPAAPATNSLFGGGAFGQAQQQPQQQQPSAFGSTTSTAFGQPQQQPSSLFGGGTAFGAAAAPKPAFGGFGATNTTTNTFGSTPFGQTQQAQQQPATNSLFGNTQPAATNNAFGGFGNTAAKPSIFGSTAQTQPAATNAFGGTAFGASQPQQQPAQTSLFGGSSLFGNTQAQGQQPAAPANSLFGGTQNTTTPSLFGNTAAPTTSLFGNTAQNQQQQQPANPFGNLFGAKPAQPGAAPSLFGNTQPQQSTTTQPSLFGNTFGQSTTNSLFGKPAAPLMNTSISGNTNMFGSTLNNGNPQGTLTASIAQPIGDNLPIFDMLPPGPRIVDLDAPKKKAGFFTDMPTRSPVPKVQMGFVPANSKLRGFGSSTSQNPANSVNGFSFTSGKPGVLSLNKSEMRASSVGPDFYGRSGSPALGSGGRQSVKKVILDKKVEPEELFVKTSSPGGLRTGKVTFSPALSIASREKDAQTPALPQPLDSPTPAARNPQRPSSFGAVPAKMGPESRDDSSSTEIGDGEYWVKPDLPTLKKTGFDELSAFRGLVVGRKGYGEIQFLEPVDLTGLPKLGALLGEVVRFDEKECSVYPESDEADKPPHGSGLNVKARLRLEKCWATDKATRAPIRDPKHPHVGKHLKRLKNMKDTDFESFDAETGTWTFTVEHF